MGAEAGSAIITYIFIPVITAIGIALAAIITHFAKKISKSVIARNEISELDKKNNIRKEIIEVIAKTVDAAVGANMQLADQMKAQGRHLTPDEARALHNSAKQVVMNSLPVSLTTSDGVLAEIIGGEERLNSIIDTLMEKSVYEYKLKRIQSKNPNATIPNVIPPTSPVVDISTTANNAAYNDRPKRKPIKK